MTTRLDLNPLITLTQEDFYQLCQNNPEVPLELNRNRELIIMSPVGGESGNREANLNFHVSLWNHQSNLGLVFSSSTIFNLPGGGSRSPDVAWVTKEKWETLTPTEKQKFPPICPDFVIELRSQSDRLKPLQEKMQEYLESGLRLGWLINPQGKTVEIYRPNQQLEILNLPVSLSGEDVLPGFNLFIE
ncbi:MAG: Uma2 family endonuclease [Gomphosphaeria aponina SAG 52.96 = DSM 107014]|uniref:Uma2 family endonuclease n=1 Tax=Gomphosphaeria aponina SAG 52.96 = DSM 107014 TaxID=1521640 RepID=A0A941GUU7_9CHRO|nr:Uma2 family endonuclease [Gomphosphaeria aponina SAG 52.96 = DSM 107014]